MKKNTISKKKVTKIITPEQFEKFSKAKKAVLVAEDVIQQIKAKLYIIDTGTYLDIDLMNNHRSDQYICSNSFDRKSAKDELDKCALECTVCARGAAFVSAVKFKNKLTIGKMRDKDFGGKNAGTATKFMQDVFSVVEQDMMEAAFEKKTIIKNSKFFMERYAKNDYNNYNNLNSNTAILDNALDYGYVLHLKYDKSKVLIAIMRNVIKNEGYFLIPKSYFKGEKELYNAMVKEVTGK